MAGSFLIPIMSVENPAYAILASQLRCYWNGWLRV